MAQRISMAEMRRRVVAFDVIREAGAVLADNEPWVVKEIQQQMYEGLNGYGEKIGDTSPYKSKYYAKKKNQMNPRPGLGNPDGYKTGAFYAGMYAEVRGDGLEIGSAEKKAAFLERLWGKIIYKAGPEARGNIRKTILKPGLVQKFAEKTGAKRG